MRMLLKDKIQEARKVAMRAQDRRRLSVLQLMLAAIKQYEVDKRLPADDAIIIGLLDTMLKQRRESILQYTKAGRQELADQEQYEIDLIQTFMPAPLDAEEIDKLITEAITHLNASSMQDMGKVMAHLKPQLLGCADMSLVSAKIKQQLS